MTAVVGMTVQRKDIATALGSARDSLTIGTEYVQALIAGGLTVVLLPVLEAGVEVLARLDGLVLTGGQDLHPRWYGSTSAPGAGVDTERDRAEIALARRARQLRLPTLAVCRGMQVVNVAAGGGLVEDLARSVDHPAVDLDLDALTRRHDIGLASGSRLRRLFEADTIAVNALHHQAVGDLGDGLVATAWTEHDHVIEAIEATDEWPLLAVQWHPEKLLSEPDGADQARLFAGFAQLVSDRRRGHE